MLVTLVMRPVTSRAAALGDQLGEFVAAGRGLPALQKTAAPLVRLAEPAAAAGSPADGTIPPSTAMVVTSPLRQNPAPGSGAPSPAAPVPPQTAESGRGHEGYGR